MTKKIWTKILIAFAVYIGKQVIPIVLENLKEVWNNFCEQYDRDNIKLLDKEIEKAMEGEDKR